MIQLLRRLLVHLARRTAVRAASWEEWLDERTCCLLDEGEGHEGPCQWLCTQCHGSGRCWNCNDEVDFGCSECDGTGLCLYGCVDGMQTDVV